MNLQRFPRYPLTFGPSPLHKHWRRSDSAHARKECSPTRLRGQLRVLYAHLGGVPARNAYSFIFRNG